MKQTVLFVLLDRYADWEAAYLASGLTFLAEDRFQTVTATPGRQPVRSIGGFTLNPDADTAAPPNFSALVLVGGLSWRTEAAAQVVPLVRAALADGTVLGGICDAAGFLGTLGALNGVSHTVNDLADLKRWAGEAYKGEAKFLARQAVRDGCLVTANGTAPLEFAKEMLLAIDAAPRDRIEQWYAFHKLGCYTSPIPFG